MYMYICTLIKWRNPAILPLQIKTKMKILKLLLLASFPALAIAQQENNFNPPPIQSVIPHHYYALLIACKDYNDRRDPPVFPNLDSTVDEAIKLKSVLER